jgi:hypothetical protein
MVFKNSVRGSKLVPEKMADDDRPIWEVISQLSAALTHEEWADLPNDGAINYRNYLYGQPKREVPEELVVEYAVKGHAA